MSELLHEIKREQGVEDAAAGHLFAGTILTTAAALTDPVAVVLDQLDPYATNGCRWQPRLQNVVVNVAESGESTHNVTVAQAVYPAKGNRCLVAFDDANLPWIVCWGPA